MRLPSLKPLLVSLLLGVLLCMGAFAFTGWYTLARQAPIATYGSNEAQFKYGSIGTEVTEGIPYWIWVVLPRLFPDKLPGSGGYTSLGITWEEGNEMPIGLTKETVGIAQVGVNCALCHIGTLRETPKGKPKLLLGAPSTQFNLNAYLQFFFDCARDPRFTANVILPEIRYNHPLSFPERWFYRYLIIPRTRAALLKQSEKFSWINERPALGSGRTDMNPLKLNVLEIPDDGSVGSTDIMAIWNKDAPQRYYHSDGLSNSLEDVVFSSALGAGASRSSINISGLKSLTNWLSQLPPPAYPFAIDTALTQKGEKIFTANCATCHSPESELVGQVIPVAKVLTDPNREAHWTEIASTAMNDYANRKPWDINSYQNTKGYTALPLAGIWARSPYLHNGSVPTLAAMLQSPEQRPKVFYRGVDVYDPEDVGFIFQGAIAEKNGFRFQTEIPGNGNQGHRYGIELQAAEKQALIEYLKTL